MSSLTRGLPAALGLALLLVARAPGAAAGQGLEALPEDVEVELARSALPQHLRADATVYALDPASGFRIVRPGGNGFHALVVRNDPAFVDGDWAYPAWRNDLLIPIAFDAAGVDAQLRVLLDVAAARAAGATPEAVRAEQRRRRAAGAYPRPSRVGISYMLSPIIRAYRDAPKDAAAGTFVYPHYMIYAPNVTNEDIGGAAPAHPFVIEPGEHGYIVVPAGRAEREGILAEHAALLDQVCALSTDWCVGGRGD